MDRKEEMKKFVFFVLYTIGVLLMGFALGMTFISQVSWEVPLAILIGGITFIIIGGSGVIPKEKDDTP